MKRYLFFFFLIFSLLTVMDLCEGIISNMKMILICSIINSIVSALGAICIKIFDKK